MSRLNFDYFSTVLSFETGSVRCPDGRPRRDGHLRPTPATRAESDQPAKRQHRHDSCWPKRARGGTECRVRRALRAVARGTGVHGEEAGRRGIGRL